MSEYQAMEFAYWKVGRRGVTFQNSDSICFRILTVYLLNLLSIIISLSFSQHMMTSAKNLLPQIESIFGPHASMKFLRMSMNLVPLATHI